MVLSHNSLCRQQQWINVTHVHDIHLCIVSSLVEVQSDSHSTALVFLSLYEFEFTYSLDLMFYIKVKEKWLGKQDTLQLDSLSLLT